MTFAHKTAISGNTKDGERKFYLLAGHWKLPAATDYARKHGLNSDFEVEWSVFDNSGHGRGGHDGRWHIAENDNILSFSAPKCHAVNRVYHFAWCAITCQHCKQIVDKYQWFNATF